MAALYIDQDAPGIGVILRRAGHSVTTALQMGFTRYQDEAHLLFAARNGLTLISFNRADYEMLHRAWTHWSMTPVHSGIIIPSQQARTDPMAAEILSLLAQDVSLDGQLYSWSPGSGWRPYTVPSQR